VKTRKVVISTRGAFGISPEATLELYKRGSSAILARRIEDVFLENGEGPAHRFDEQIYGWREYFSARKPLDPFQTYFSPDEKFVLTCPNIARDDSDLVEVVEQLGTRSNDALSTLEVIEIPEDVKWYVQDCEGIEHVAEEHRTWHGKA
jgi:hypothetical protein